MPRYIGTDGRPTTALPAAKRAFPNQTSESMEKLNKERAKQGKKPLSGTPADELDPAFLKNWREEQKHIPED